MISQAAFIGLGAMGLPMTRNLGHHGVTVHAYDADAQVREQAAALEGVLTCETVSGALDGVEAVFTCLPNNDVVRQVYLGADGIGAALVPGMVTIDCSTISPSVSREIAAAFAEKDAAHMDVSMLGSVPQAESGEIGFVVGGDREAFTRIEPLLAILGRFAKYAGPSGAGNQIKLIHQTLVAINAAAVAEAVALCRATDTDLDCFYDVVCNGGGMAISRYFENRVPRMRQGDFSPLFMLDFMAKDAGLAQQLADEASLDTPVTDRVMELYRSAQDKGWGREDFSAIAHLYEEALGRGFKDAE